ncbi:hypothetical protein NIES4074_35250 [Cylindrospermum sp. NIES-4074]|nr:hypothetical protein NIES4074_35250 [Cylindrospermum sp. NIES-4074]
MKVVKQTPTILILREVPIFLWLFGSVFVLVGLCVISIVGNVTSLTCNRIEPAQGNCQFVKSGILKSQVMTMPVKALQGAKVDTIRSDDGNTYQVVIVINNTDVSFTSYSSSGVANKQAIVSDINNFVETPSERSLIVKQDDRWLIIPFGGLFVLAGSIIVATSNIVDVVIDKNLGNFTLKKKNLLGKKVAHHQIREIANVQVEESTTSSGSPTYEAYICLVSGDRLVLMFYGESGRFNKQKTVDSIRKFLNLAN